MLGVIRKAARGMQDLLFCSFAMHITLILTLAALPFITRKYLTPAHDAPAPIIVDLSKVTIAEETNLPPAPPKKEAPKATLKPSAISQAPAVSSQTQKELSGLIEEIIREEPKKTEPKKEAPPAAGSVQDLLASIEKLRAEKGNDAAPNILGETVEGAQIDANPGFEEAAKTFSGSLTLSQLDALRIKLRNCWNIDPGAKGIEDMVIVLKIKLSQNGRVENLSFEDQDRYENDPVFRSVADSARRAVLVCQPFDLPRDKYQNWKDAVFTFNPKSSSVI